MKLRVLYLSVVFLFAALTKAEGGVLNDFGSFKEFVNSMEFSDGILYDIEDNVWLNTVSGSLFTLQDKAHEVGLASLRAGYGVPEIAFGQIEANIPNIISTYIPEQFKDLKINLKALTLAPMVGFAVGYDLRERDIAWGPTFGVKGIF